MLTAPEGFAVVEPLVYRCSGLDSINLSFLETLDLNNIVYLSPEKPPRTHQEWAKSCNVNLLNFGRKTWMSVGNNHPALSTGGGDNNNNSTKVEYYSHYNRGGVRQALGGSCAATLKLIPDQVASDTVTYLLDKQFHPVLLVDASLVLGLFRKIQQWAYSGIVLEHRRMCGHRYNFANELFLELAEVRLHIQHDNNNNNSNDDDNHKLARYVHLFNTSKYLEDYVPNGPSTYNILLPPTDRLPDWFLFQISVALSQV